MLKQKDVLTTGQVAKICNVAPRTVSKWFDSGQLRGYRIPGSKDRRIPLAQLLRFMRAHGIPLDGLATGQTHVLIVDSDSGLTAVLRDFLEGEQSYTVTTAESAFEAGVLMGHSTPDVVVVDITLPDVITKELLHTIRTDERLRTVKVIGVSGGITEGQGQMLLQQGFDHYLRKPFEIRQLLDLIEEPAVGV